MSQEEHWCFFIHYVLWPLHLPSAVVHALLQLQFSLLLDLCSDPIPLSYEHALSLVFYYEGVSALDVKEGRPLVAFSIGADEAISTFKIFINAHLSKVSNEIHGLLLPKNIKQFLWLHYYVLVLEYLAG